jgi:hypothetical protein
MICRSTSRFHHLRHVIDPEDLAFGADQGSYGQCWLSGTRSNIQNFVPTANQPIFDKGLRDRRKHLPDDFAVLFPEPRRITPYAYNFLVGLHQQKYTYQAVDGEFGNNAKVRVADKPEIAEHKPRLQVVILELVPNSESIDLLS